MISVAESVAGQKAILEKLTAADNGKFLSEKGTPLPW